MTSPSFFGRPALKLAVLGLTALMSLVGCGGTERETPPPLSFNIAPEEFEDDDPCTPPAKNCECSEPGAEADCGTITRHSADYITCSYGVITCGEDYTWGECVGDEVSVLPIPDTGASK